MIRAIKKEDLEEVKRIHDKFYKDEFTLPDFVTNYLGAFVVEDENKNIITVGGIRTIVEVIAITNKDFSHRQRRYALYNLLDASVYVAKQFNYDQIHIFIQDDTYKQVAENREFHSTKGHSLVMEV